ncbi:MAG: excinuclease ABC subunit UvrC [Oscillospiraceae bacterium]
MDNPNLGKLREKTSLLPTLPGVYIMKNSKKEIIYIGKAKSLKNRVSSYFRAIDKHLPKVYKMVENVEDFEYIVATSEFEALILEASLIKQHKPQYNILLKDDKGYSYVKIDNECFPRITEAKQKVEDKATYIGPFYSSFVVKQTVDETNKAFMLPTCTRKFPQEIRKGRPCLNFHIKQCMGVCTGKISQNEYNDIIGQAIEFIKDGGNSAIKQLEEKMYIAADNMEFEKAAQLRDRINAIKKISEKQRVVEFSASNQDIIGFVKTSENTCATVIKFRDKRLVDKEDFLIGESDDLVQTRYEFLVSYYNKSKDIPPEIVLDGEVEDREILEKYLSELLGKKASIVIPQKGERLRLVEMALANSAEKLSQVYKNSGREVKALDKLGKLLGLKNTPEYIEAYDISNFGDDVIVGGMVVFKNGKPLKSAYKRFNMKTVSERDDYASMREVISRRLSHYIEEKDSGVGFGKLPDLILLDGGLGHVNAIKPIIEEMGLQINVFGMVKDSKHKTRAISSDGGEIEIASYKETFTLVSAIQEEVHRFSIAYSRKKHSKKSFLSQLTEIEGIGEKRAKTIMQHFKTNKALKEASAAMIAEIKGISTEQAEKIYKYLHK